MLGFAPIGALPIGASPRPAGPVAWSFNGATGAFELRGGPGQVGQIGGYLLGQNWLSALDFLGAAAASQVIAWVEISLGTGYNGPPLLSLTAAERTAAIASATWSPWQKYVPGQYQARLVNWRLAIQAPNPGVQAIVTALKAQCSVEDRVDHYLGVTVPSAGLPITFTPDGATSAAQFNKGPTGSTLPLVTVSNLQAGDTYQIGSLNLTGCTVTIFNSGVAVSRANVNVTAQGF